MMRQERRNLLTSNLITFTQDLDTDDVLIHLQSNACGIFTDHVVDTIKSCRNPQASRKKLIDTVKTRGDIAFDAFYLALVNSRQDHLAAILRPHVDESLLQSIENQPQLRRSERVAGLRSSDTKCSSFLSSLSEDEPMELEGLLEDLCVETDGPKVQSLLQYYENNKSNIYPNFSTPKGLCLLINNEKFAGMPQRQGTCIDQANLVNLFTQLGYRVQLRNDLTAREMSSCITEFACDPFHTRSSSAVLIVLTHGEHDVLMGSDDEPLYIQNALTLLNSENSPQLAGKPKLILFQACRGERYDKGIATTETDGGQPRPDGFGILNPFACMRPQVQRRQEVNRIPSEADFLIAYATPPRYVSWRNNMHGSWFVQAVCQVFARHASSMDLVEMLTIVNRRVSQNSTKDNDKQIPDFHCRLRKKFFFFPTSERSSEV